MRHSLAHILAAAVQQLYPGAKFGVGPVIEDGFYYDFDLKTTISAEDLPKIEAAMQKIIKAKLPFERLELSIAEAREQVKDQPYKSELLEQLIKTGSTGVDDTSSKPLAKDDRVSFYKIGEFTDLCRGGHVESTAEVGAFKLDRVSGAYWRGDEKRPMLQRVYGVAFATSAEVEAALKQREEAKKRDHRRMGQEQDLFVVSDLVGTGLPLFTPRGTILRDKLNQLSQSLRREKGFQKVWVPHIGKRQLYETSGHWDKFGDELFLVKSQETSDEFVLKPMNCPHHQQIYASKPRSYRDLPIKYLETTTIYRDERSGELHGLSRVRSVTQDDSHIFCTTAQIESVVGELLEITQAFYKAIDMGLKVHLSFRDEQDKYLGDKKLWSNAEAILEKVAKQNQLNFVLDKGEAAFYGPKIDMVAIDSLKREWQVATIQLDFVQPARFKLVYIDEAGKEQTPVMVHFALLGSIERFLSVYIEHTGGAFPIWLAPEQVRLINVNDDKQVLKTVDDFATKLTEAGIRFEKDLRSESVGKKIREAEMMKVPYTIVVGEKEAGTNKVTPRVRKDIAVKHPEQSLGVDEFIQTVVNETRSHVRHSSL